MVNNYNLRKNPKRKVIFSPVSAPKKINCNESTHSDLEPISENMDHDGSSEFLGFDQASYMNPPPQPGPQANPLLNANRPAFIPTSRGPQPSFSRLPPPHVQGQQHHLNQGHSLPLPHVQEQQHHIIQGHSLPPPNDSNLANYIQSAITEGMRSSVMRENRNATLMINAVQNLTDIITRRVAPSSSPQRESTPPTGDVESNLEYHQENDSQPNPVPQDAISRLESMVNNLSLKVSSIDDRLNSNHNAPPTQQQHQEQQNLYSAHSYRLPLHKWQVKFSGEKDCKLSADDFLNILSLKRDTHDVTWAMIGAHFDSFLEGRALSWYYMYRNRNPRVEWQVLKTAFFQNFSRLESDEEIMVKLANRRQQDKESFDDFCDAMLELRNKLKIDYSDVQIIGLMRNNCKLGIRQMMVTYQITTLNDFIEQCKRCDKLLLPSPSYYNPRRVHEIQAPLQSSLETSGSATYPLFAQPNPSSIEALRSHNNGNMGVVQCWNCDENGHRWMDCGKNRTTTFCYRCGTKNVTCVNCERCKNFRVQEIVSGESPHPLQFPDFHLARQN